MSTAPRKTWIMRILEIFQKYSDENYPLTQRKIIDLLQKEYNIVCERKSVARNIARLRDMGYDIVSNKRGSYLIANKDFTESELRLLIDCVKCSRHINPTHSLDLMEKLGALGGPTFKGHVKNIYKTCGCWDKSKNMDFFLNVEIFDEAISEGRQVSFFYNKYGIDKKLHKKSEERRVVNPYQMILHNQRYYLAGNDCRYDDLLFYRIEKITCPELLDTPSRKIETLPGYENGLDWGKLTTCMPYLYVETPKKVSFKCEHRLADDVMDWFGSDFKVKIIDDKYIEVTVNASLKAMLFWLMQYGENVEVLSPSSLRQELKEKLAAILEKYDNAPASQAKA